MEEIIKCPDCGLLNSVEWTGFGDAEYIICPRCCEFIYNKNMHKHP